MGRGALRGGENRLQLRRAVDEHVLQQLARGVERNRLRRRTREIVRAFDPAPGSQWVDGFGGTGDGYVAKLTAAGDLGYVPPSLADPGERRR